MYLEFFNLTRKPFELVPDPAFIYLSHSHRRALTYLDYGVRERAGFIMLTGDVGSGKTTLIRDLIGKNYQNVVLAKVFNTKASAEQLLGMINDDFGLAVAGKDKVALMRDLNDFLLEQYAAGNQPMLIIDEAQNLDAALLEEIRLLSNLENSHSKLLQIVLVGQPELRRTLSAPELLQLRQRISINCHLRPLTRQEVAEYVIHRLRVAGNESALEFPEPSMDLVFRYSRGIPRLINIFCDFIVLAAFAEESRVATEEIVNDVVHDLDFENQFWAVTPAANGLDTRREEVIELTALESTAHDPLLGELSARLQSLEQQSSVQLAAVKEIAETLNLLRGAVADQSASYQTAGRELRARVDAVSSELQYLELCRSDNRQPNGGLARRLLDGITGTNGKK